MLREVSLRQLRHTLQHDLQILQVAAILVLSGEATQKPSQFKPIKHIIPRSHFGRLRNNVAELNIHIFYSLDDENYEN